MGSPRRSAMVAKARAPRIATASQRAIRATRGIGRGYSIIKIRSGSPGARSLSSHMPGRPQPGPQPIPGVTNIVAIGSGKGGVGKTTIAVNLALGLARMGHKVGLLDADVYGPNVPLMLGATDTPALT